MIHAHNLDVRRDGLAVLHGVCLSVVGGEVVGLLGPAGAGKSTLISTLCGDLQPSAGHAWLGGKKVTAWSRRERGVRRAVLPQTAPQQIPLRAMDFVLLGRAPHLHGAPGAQDHDICGAALAWVEAAHLRDRPCASLSFGQMRQVQMAQLLAQLWGQAQHGDAYLFLDEPLSGLDPLAQQRMLSLIKQLAGEGFAILMALHDLNLAAQSCDRLVMLKAGRVVVEGPPAQALTPQRLRRVFGIDVKIAHDTQCGAPQVTAA
jgi:iron complex transport system ATP-binding protein